MQSEGEYLKARGWWSGDEGDEWFDPIPGDIGRSCPIEQALRIQRSRDAADERRAWVEFATAGMRHGGYVDGGSVEADAMLREYRKRFGAAAPTPVTPTPAP